MIDHKFVANIHVILLRALCISWKGTFKRHSQCLV